MPEQSIELSNDTIIDQTNIIIDDLNTVLQKEQELVKQSKLSKATDLLTQKSQLVETYIQHLGFIKQNSEILKQTQPKSVEALRQKHYDLAQTISYNSRVLATAHAISESLMRDAAKEISNQKSLKTYGNSNIPYGNRNTNTPILVNKSF